MFDLRPDMSSLRAGYVWSPEILSSEKVDREPK
jgi:hypothetical protein